MSIVSVTANPIATRTVARAAVRARHCLFPISMGKPVSETKLTFRSRAFVPKQSASGHQSIAVVAGALG
jgi:hypothetical protein